MDVIDVDIGCGIFSIGFVNLKYLFIVIIMYLLGWFLFVFYIFFICI